MAYELRVDPAQVCHGGAQTSSATRDAAVKFAGCENDLAEAAPGWVGASQQALAELAAAWEDRHAALHSRLTSLSQRMTDSAISYATADGEPGDAVL